MKIRWWWNPLIFAIAIVAIYFKTLSASYLPWDDDTNIFNNHSVKNFLLGDFWRAPIYGMYIPLVSSVWATIYQLFDGSVFAYRIFNLGLHLANSLLVFLLLEKIYFMVNQRKSWWLVLIASMAFVVHPVQVGTVAWISGSRDLWSTFFALLSVWFLLSEIKHKDFWATFAFGLGLLCKPQIVTMPLAILFIGFLFSTTRYKLISWGWLAMSLGSVLVTVFAQKGAIDLETPLFFRPAFALDGLGFQLGKLVWPFGTLAVDYGRIPGALLNNPNRMLASILIATLAISSLFYLVKKFMPAQFFWVWFILMLPVCGLVPSGFQEISTVTDHYQYLPMLIVSFAILSIFMVPKIRDSKRNSLLAQISIVGLLVLWSATSQKRAEVWLNENNFFQDMLKNNENSFPAAIGMGNIAFKMQDFNQAEIWHSKALELRPYDIVALGNRAATLFQMRRYDEVFKMRGALEIPKVQVRMQLNPFPTASFLTSLGSSAVALKEFELGFEYLCKATKLQPYDINYKRNAQIIEGLVSKQCK